MLILETYWHVERLNVSLLTYFQLKGYPALYFVCPFIFLMS